MQGGGEMIQLQINIRKIDKSITIERTMLGDGNLDDQELKMGIALSSAINKIVIRAGKKTNAKSGRLSFHIIVDEDGGTEAKP